MAYSENLADKMRAQLKRKRDLEEKKMFGGLCFMWRGHMLCGVAESDLILRVDKEEYPKLLKTRSIRPMVMRGKPFGTYIMVDEKSLKTSASLKKWLDRAEAFVAKLPKK